VHAQKDPINCFFTNSLAVLNLAKLAEKYPKVEVIQVSSSHAFFDHDKVDETKEVYTMSRVLEHKITETFRALDHRRLRVLYLPNVESANRGENYLIGKLFKFFSKKYDKKLIAPLKLNNVNASLSAITLPDFITWFFSEVIEGSIFNENTRIRLQPAATFEIKDIVTAVLRKYGVEFDEYRSDDKLYWNCKTTSQTIVIADFLERPNRYESRAQEVIKVTIGGKRRTADEFVRSLF
jgi:nucleoside-diphosphate-sugar epimerase